MKIHNLLSLALASLIFGGCASSDFGFREPCGASPFGKEYSHKKVDFGSMMGKVVSSILSQSANQYGLTKDVVVTDFVDVKTLSNKNQLGFILSSHLKNELASNKKFKIIEAETAKYFKIGSDGVTLLSRDKNDTLRDEIGAEYAFVGSYAVTDERVVVYVKLINLLSGKIEAAATVEEVMTCEIKDILERKSSKIL